MRVLETIAELRHQVALAKSRGERVGFVPTMGALHAGHQALMRAARAQCDFVVASIFVNPTQFGPGEDFESYPRTPDQDAERASAAGVDLLWRPTGGEMHPPGDQTRVSVGALADQLCGASRPGHFDAVATVVVKLLGAVQPDVVFFGEKDFQQTVVVRRVVSDLHIGVEVRTVPTVRDPDGLALSSRNRYLSEQERSAALAIPRTLQRVADLVAAGERSVGRLRAVAEVEVGSEPLVEPEYVEIVDPHTLEAAEGWDGPLLLAIAARVGSARLIDNRILDPQAATVAPAARAEAPASTPSRQMKLESS